jgi:hypothetical protein
MSKVAVGLSGFILVLLLAVSGGTGTAAQDAASQTETEKTKSSTYEGESVVITSKIKVGDDNPDGKVWLTYSTSLDPLKDLILQSMTELQSYTECGSRAYFNSASLSINDNTPHVVGNLEVENWICQTMDVPEFHGFNVHMTKKFVGKTLLNRTSLNVDVGYNWDMDPQTQRLRFQPVVMFKDATTGQVVPPTGLSNIVSKTLLQKTMTTAATLEDAVNVKLPDSVGHQEISPNDVKFTASEGGGISAQYTGKVSGSHDTISDWLK